jgi:hypothetical protein
VQSQRVALGVGDHRKGAGFHLDSGLGKGDPAAGALDALMNHLHVRIAVEEDDGPCGTRDRAFSAHHDAAGLVAAPVGGDAHVSTLGVSIRLSEWWQVVSWSVFARVRRDAVPVPGEGRVRSCSGRVSAAAGSPTDSLPVRPGSVTSMTRRPPI